MSSIDSNLVKVAKTQYNYKLKAHLDQFMSLVVVQLIAILFSLGGVGSSSTSTGSFSLRVNNYSSDIIIVFTIFWMFFMAINMTTKEYRDMDFSFVSNRLSSNLANISFLLTTSFIAGLTAVLGGSLYRLISYFNLGSTRILSENFFLPPSAILTSLVVTTLYLLLISGIGYFCGMLTQQNKLFIVLLPSFVIGSVIVLGRGGRIEIVQNIFNFYTQEGSLALFAIKAIFTAAIFFYGASIFSNRLEVRE